MGHSIDMDKVTSGLEHCTAWAGLHRCQPKFYGYDCPYDDEADCRLALMLDALALLKEQEKRINELEEKLRLLECGDRDTLQSAMMPAT